MRLTINRRKEKLIKYPPFNGIIANIWKEERKGGKWYHFRNMLSANEKSAYLRKFIGVWQSTNGRKKARININAGDVLVLIAMSIKVTRMKKQLLSRFGQQVLEQYKNMIWRDEATTVTPAPMPQRLLMNIIYRHLTNQESLFPARCDYRPSGHRFIACGL